ncbi:hypothetical protein Tco_0415651 [Tanacetum coccineum]
MLTALTEIVLLVPSVSAVGEIFTNVDNLPTDSLMPDVGGYSNLLNTSTLVVHMMINDKLVDEAIYKDFGVPNGNGLHYLLSEDIEQDNGEGSTVPVESHHIPTSASSTSQPPTLPPSMQTTHVAEEAATMSHDSSIPRVKKLENRIKSSKARRRVRLIVSEDCETQERHAHDLEPDFEFTAPEEVYTVEPDISTASVPVSTAGEEVSTASPEVKIGAENLVYISRSAAKRKDKGKAIIKEAKPVQKKTKFQLEQERLWYKEALRLQEKLDEEERQRIARVHEEANNFNAEEWDNIQAQIEADEELAQKLQAEERGKFSKVEKARLLVEMINERKRLFAQQRAEQRRNKPMTQAQQRTYMCNYIKNMGSHTVTPRQGRNTRRNIMDIITTQWCQQ